MVGYRARRNSRVLDLTQIARHRPRDYWDLVYREEDAPRVVLEPEEFYLLISSEAVRIPPSFAAEMSAYAEVSGELRSHYAGFFDPGFGHDPNDHRRLSRAVLEVRAHDVPFMVEQHQPVCKLTFERVTEPPTILYGQDVASNYQGQQVMLSKHFARDHSASRSAQPPRQPLARGASNPRIGQSPWRASSSRRWRARSSWARASTSAICSMSSSRWNGRTGRRRRRTGTRTSGSWGSPRRARRGPCSRGGRRGCGSRRGP